MEKRIYLSIDLTKEKSSPRKYHLAIEDDIKLPKFISLSHEELIKLRDGIDKVLAIKS